MSPHFCLEKKIVKKKKKENVIKGLIILNFQKPENLPKKLSIFICKIS
jgi:hypothetical protein